MGIRTAVLLSCMVLCGCAFTRLKKDLSDQGKLAMVKGRVRVKEWSGAPTLVMAVTQPSGDRDPLRLMASESFARPASYDFIVPPGEYAILAVEDANGNGAFDEGERIAWEENVELRAGKTRRKIELLITETVPPKAEGERRGVVDETMDVAGEVVSLDDPKFGPEVAKQGMWEPFDFLKRNGAGIYQLGAYEAGKIPVLFVHGMTGYPQEFRALIEGLDRNRFQPWFYHYPSGYDLPHVVRQLDSTLTRLETRHGFERMCLVAHSMGGVVSRALLGERGRRGDPLKVRTFVSINAPFGGMPSAEIGVRMAPAVVQAWRDITPRSTFVRTLYEGPLPSGMRYHLLFSHDGKDASDGTVPLSSQLRDEAQREATVVRGFQSTHQAALWSPPVMAAIAEALESCAS